MFFSARVMHFFTDTQYDYNRYRYNVGSDKTSATFQVKACNDAHIGLFDKQDTDTAYEIVIGGSSNKWSYIRRKRLVENKAWAETEDILSCETARPFWISWKGAFIEVGRGNLVGEGRFLSWQDPEPLGVSIVAVSTGWDAVGDWEFSLVECEYFNKTHYLL